MRKKIISKSYKDTSLCLNSIRNNSLFLIMFSRFFIRHGLYSKSSKFIQNIIYRFIFIKYRSLNLSINLTGRKHLSIWKLFLRFVLNINYHRFNLNLSKRYIRRKRVLVPKYLSLLKQRSKLFLLLSQMLKKNKGNSGAVLFSELSLIFDKNTNSKMYQKRLSLYKEVYSNKHNIIIRSFRFNKRKLTHFRMLSKRIQSARLNYVSRYSLLSKLGLALLRKRSRSLKLHRYSFKNKKFFIFKRWFSRIHHRVLGKPEYKFYFKKLKFLGKK
jgi:hypothetical protein